LGENLRRGEKRRRRGVTILRRLLKEREGGVD